VNSILLHSVGWSCLHKLWWYDRFMLQIHFLHTKTKLLPGPDAETTVLVKLLSPHVQCRVMTLNTVLSLEHSQLLWNNSSQSKTSWNDILCLVNSFLDNPTCPENEVCSSRILVNIYQRTWCQTSKSIIFTVTAVRTSNFARSRLLSTFQCSWTWLNSL